MGGRKNNKYYKKNNKSSKKGGNTQPQTQSLPPASNQQILGEVLQIRELLVKYKERLRNTKSQFGYLVSTKWLSNWKLYTGYEAFGKEEDPEHTKGFGKRRPGAKINDDLLAKPDVKFIKVPEDMVEYSYLNSAIIEDNENETDFIVVDEDIWVVLQQYYPEAIPIRRPMRKRKSGQPYTDSLLHHFNVLIVGKQKIKSCTELSEQEFTKIMDREKNNDILEKLLSIKKIRVPGIWSLSSVKVFIQKLMASTDEYQDVSTIQFWKMQNYLSFAQVRQNVASYFRGGQEGILATSLHEAEENQLDVDDFIKNSSVILVICGDTPITKLLPPNVPNGYCENCIQDRQLISTCLCKQVFYCSRKCLYDDKQYHYNSCGLSYDSDDDQQFKKKTVKFDITEIQCGLNNLGNTCYMNSSLQALCNLNWFYQYFASNEYNKNIDPTELENNKGIFIHKFSKFVKKLATWETYSPYSLKGQLSYFISVLKGYDQHDANDFILYLLTTLNEFSVRHNGEAFSQFISTNLAGRFQSTITCPECKIESTTQDVYLQVSLPVKSKIQEKQISYVKIVDWDKYQKGIVAVSNWKTVCQEVGVPINCRKFVGNQGGDIQQILEQSIEEIQKKHKREQLLFVEYLEPAGNTIEIKINLCYYKIIGGNQQKADYGFPIILQFDSNAKLYEIYEKIAEKIQLGKQQLSYLEQFKMKIEKQLSQLKNFKQQKSAQNSGDEEETEANQEQKQPEVNRAYCEQIKKFQSKYEQELYELKNKIKFRIGVVTGRKKKKPCTYCNKKCAICLLPFSLITSVSEFSKRGESPLQLNLLLDQKIPIIEIYSKSSKYNEFTTISECLEQFSQPEQLDEYNAWYCEICDMMRLAEKRLTISQYPKTLILQLKRFKDQNGKKVKNNEAVWYPEILQIKEAGVSYRFSSVIIHEGSLEGGHYWAICKKGDEYWEFNDDEKSKTDKYFHKGAYILFYEMI